MNKFYIAPRPPLLFLHIPKTAGTSMRAFLASHYETRDICPAVGWNTLAELPPETIRNYGLVQGHYFFSVRQLVAPNAKTLVLLRNPLNRTLSALRHLRRDSNFSPLHQRAREMSISEILRDPQMFAVHRNAQTAYLSAAANPFAVIDYLREGARRGERRDPAAMEKQPDINLAKEHLETIDFIGLVEQLDLLMEELPAAMGFHPRTFLTRSNNAPEGPSNFGDLSPEDIELLRRCNDLDLELYAHAEKIVARRRPEGLPLDLSKRAVLQRLCVAGAYRVQDESFEIDLANQMPGSGWYPPELQGGLATRWTGPEREFTLELPLTSEADFRVSLRFLSPLPLEPGDFEVVANGLHLPVGLQRQGRVYTAISDLPSLAFQSSGVPFCELVFSIPKVCTQHERGDSDKRNLGVLVNSIKFDRIN